MSEDISSDEDIMVVKKKPINRVLDSDSDSDEVSFKDAKSSTMYEHAMVSQMADETSEKLISEDEDDEKSSTSIFPNKRSDISWSNSDGGSKQTISDGDDSYEKSMAFRTPQRAKPLVYDSDDDKDSTKDHSTDEDSDIVQDSFEDDEKVKSTTLQEKSMMKPSINHNNKQPTLDGFVQKFSKAIEILDETDDKIECSRSEYNTQMNKIKELEGQMLKIKTLISSIKLANLPDKGQSLKDRFESYKSTFLKAQERLRNMVITKDEAPVQELHGKAALTQNWANIEAGIAAVLPKTFGKKGLENHNAERALTAERLEQLHGSLKNCPNDEQLAEDPVGLKVPLKSHQKRAIAWMNYRERQKPRGGILADDMGLGKTLTLLSLVLVHNQKSKENDEKEEDEDDDESSIKKHTKYKGGTLVVCPASLLHQWSGEIESKMKRGMLSWEIYHGPKREVKAKRLAKHDVVITTYSIAMHEHENEGPIFRVRWNRIILDEAHQIRNHKSKTSIACCELAGINRWALTGTPVHNKELDMYALLKFLRCSPFDDLAVWKRWVTDKNSGGGERLNTVISSLMLRRTKTELMEQGKLTGMPSRKWDLVVVELDESETRLYQKVLMFSQTLFAEFLHQHAEKTQDMINLRRPNNDNPNGEYFKMRQKLLRMNKMTEISQHDILLLLLRLRQICCHPFLITGMLQGDEDLGEGEPEETEELNLLEQLNKLNLDENDEDNDFAERIGLSDKPVGMREATKGILNPSHPVFARERMSSKIKSMLNFIKKILPSGDKIIIVSQWTKFLELVELHLDGEGVRCLTLNGHVPTAKRNDIVSDFNDPSSQVKILLLSLTAGGVGLNLIGANHLFLIDLHWNPQLENQAQDRIYRMGQKKNVNVYKFMTTGTIEEKIKKLQENKLTMAENLMSGSKQVVGNKLTLQDMKMLFNM